MDEFEYGVLTALVKKYNDSVVSKGGSCRNLKISLTLKHKALSSYSGRDSFKFIDDNDKKLAALEKRGYIFVRRDKNGALESVDLNISAVEEVIKVCGLDSKSVHLKNILEILQNTPVYGFTVQFVHSEREYVATIKLYLTLRLSCVLFLTTAAQDFQMRRHCDNIFIRLQFSQMRVDFFNLFTLVLELCPIIGNVLFGWLTSTHLKGFQSDVVFSFL